MRVGMWGIGVLGTVCIGLGGSWSYVFVVCIVWVGGGLVACL